MDLTTLKSNKGARHRRKRVGRGNGSGMGTYSTRGMKGQNARSGGNRRPGFEGGQTPFVQRMPKLKGFKNPGAVTYQVLNVKDLNIFDDGTEINQEVLYKKGLISKKNQPVKLLGDGDLSKKLTVTVDSATKSAEEKINKAKGKLNVTKIPKKKDSVRTKKIEEKEETPENKS